MARVAEGRRVTRRRSTYRSQGCPQSQRCTERVQPMAPAQPSPLGTLLMHTRKSADLTQEALAERAGVSVNTISNLEAGRGHLPRQATLDLLAEALAGALPVAERDPLRAACREAALASRAQRQPAGPPGPAASPASPPPPSLPAGALTFVLCVPADQPEQAPAPHAALPH